MNRKQTVNLILSSPLWTISEQELSTAGKHTHRRNSRSPQWWTWLGNDHVPHTHLWTQSYHPRGEQEQSKDKLEPEFCIFVKGCPLFRYTLHLGSWHYSDIIRTFSYTFLHRSCNAREHHNLLVTRQSFSFWMRSTPSTGRPFPVHLMAQDLVDANVCYGCRCTLRPALHVRLIETQVCAVCRPYQSSEQERPWLHLPSAIQLSC